MKVDLSPAEIGAILHAMESVYPRVSDEIQTICPTLYNAVFENLSDFGLYLDWVDEFDLLDEY